LDIHSINSQTVHRVGVANNSSTNELKGLKIMNKTAVILAVVLGVCLVSALNSCKHDPIGIPGCTDAAACNYNPQATTDDGSCDFVSCSGCTDPTACNYNPDSISDDGSCIFEEFGYDCDGNVMGMRTALDHAYECESVLGPLPRFSCADAVEVPSTLNGIPQTYPITEEGNGSSDPNDCDHPWAFGMACQTGNKVGRYNGLNTDGSENPDVVFMTFCRDGGLGVIGHKFSTGETCFFSIVDEGNPINSPIPGEKGYNDAWMSPSVVAADKCQNCHMASPFLHSPAVDQLMNPDNPTELLVPLTGNNPYSVIGAEFPQLHTTSIQNSCTSCHRPQCTQHFENYPLDELTMPPPFQNATDFDHSTISIADRQAIRDWCNTLDFN